MERKRLSSEEISLLVDDVEEKQLLKWQDKWKDDPWGYVFYSALSKLPFYFLIWVVLFLADAKQFFSDPLPYLGKHWFKIVTGQLVILWAYRTDWRKKALKYYFLSASRPSLPRPDADHRIIKLGRRSEERIPVKWERWENRRWVLALLFAFGITAAFIIIFYLMHGLKENEWTWSGFMDVFEGSAFYVICGIFLFLGFVFGYSVWSELKSNYQLFIQKKSGNATFGKNAVS